MFLDLAVLAVLAIAAASGALSGALRQLVQLGAVVVGWLAARRFGADVAEGLGRSLPGPVARSVAPVVLFIGIAAAVSLLGVLLLRATGLARAVRAPADRGLGAVLGGAKGALGAWVLLSAIALAGPAAPGAVPTQARASDFAALARRHNLLVRLDPHAAGMIERAVEAARLAQRARASDPDAARLLADPRVRALARGDEGGGPDPDEVARALQDPELRALVERLAGRAVPADEADAAR